METNEQDPQATDAATRFVIYARNHGRRRPFGSSSTTLSWQLAERAEAATLSDARVALRTLAGDAAEAGEAGELLGIFDRLSNEWPLWPWGCATCGRVETLDRHYRCPGCRRDLGLGEPFGTTSREQEASVREDAARRDVDPYADTFIGPGGRR